MRRLGLSPVTSSVILKKGVVNVSKKHSEYSLIAILLLIVGIVMFFKSVRLYSVEFYHIGAISTGAILITLLFVTMICMFVMYKPIMKYIAFGLVGMLVLSVILGSRLHFVGSLLDLLLMLLPLAAGSGLLIRQWAYNKK